MKKTISDGAKIAVCISTHNRPDQVKKTIEEWRRYKPYFCDIFIVDDASRVPVAGASHRFEMNQGIARTKSKCLELARGYDHVFLADDDIYPTRDDWFVPYVNSIFDHLCFTFEIDSYGVVFSKSVRELERHDTHIIYSRPNGCLLYMTKKAVDTVPQFDHRFKGWGFEHVAYSIAIYNAGLTPQPFIDIPNSLDYFHSMDYFREIASSVTLAQKHRYFDLNRKIIDEYEAILTDISQ